MGVGLTLGVGLGLGAGLGGGFGAGVIGPGDSEARLVSGGSVEAGADSVSGRSGAGGAGTEGLAFGGPADRVGPADRLGSPEPAALSLWVRGSAVRAEVVSVAQGAHTTATRAPVARTGVVRGPVGASAAPGPGNAVPAVPPSASPPVGPGDAAAEASRRDAPSAAAGATEPTGASSPAATAPGPTAPAAPDGREPPGSEATGAAADRPVPAIGRLWPVGVRPAVVRGWEPPPTRYGRGHRGVDLTAAPGTPVRAPAAGTVAFAGRVAGVGVVSVDLDGTDLRTTFQPVTARVRKGDRVTAGTVLGTAGDAGSHCTEPCLHWGLRRDRDQYLDPLSLLPPWLRDRSPSVLLPVLGVPVPGGGVEGAR